MHQQAMNNTHTLEEAYNPEMQQEKKLKALPDQALKCPRCDSTNTKFCYYNNYSLAQPRYFCKGCRRYWTQGGSLRNVPVGGGCRKNKRSSTTLSSSSSTSKRTQDQILTTTTTTTATTTSSGSTTSSPMLASFQNQVLQYDPHDLTFAFARLQKPLTKPAGYDYFLAGNADHHSLAHTTTTPGFLDILRSSGGGAFDADCTGVGIHNLYHQGFAGLGGNMGEEAVPPVWPTGEIGGGTPGTTIKEETLCKGVVDGDGKALMGLQYLQVGGGDGNMGLDNGRDCWGGVGSSIWHGLVNSSLM